MENLGQFVVTGGAVGTVVVLLFRTYWKAEDRDDKFIDRLVAREAVLTADIARREEREQELLRENAALRRALAACEHRRQNDPKPDLPA